jgi:hypothetical protein
MVLAKRVHLVDRLVWDEKTRVRGTRVPVWRLQIDVEGQSRSRRASIRQKIIKLLHVHAQLPGNQARYKPIVGVL